MSNGSENHQIRWKGVPTSNAHFTEDLKAAILMKCPNNWVKRRGYSCKPIRDLKYLSSALWSCCPQQLCEVSMAEYCIFQMRIVCKGLVRDKQWLKRWFLLQLSRQVTDSKAYKRGVKGKGHWNSSNWEEIIHHTEAQELGSHPHISFSKQALNQWAKSPPWINMVIPANPILPQ